MRRWLYIFLHLNFKENYFLSSCLLLGKHLLILEILQEVASEFPTPGGTSKKIGNFNSAFEKADSQSSVRDF
jgi:hypothetical protein